MQGGSKQAACQWQSESSCRQPAAASQCSATYQLWTYSREHSSCHLGHMREQLISFMSGKEGQRGIPLWHLCLAVAVQHEQAAIEQR